MITLAGSMALWMAMGSTGGIFFNRDPNNHVLPPQPGYGAGFRNGNPDGYGWFQIDDQIPLGADRVPDYYFRRYFVVPASQSFMPTYYDNYSARGQRYIPFVGCGGGVHPASGAPVRSTVESRNPYRETLNDTPRISAPTFSGRVEAAPINPGSTGLRP
jgi:hypothetical protein